MTDGNEFPLACDDVHHLNRELIDWVARSAPGATLGKTRDAVVTTVPIGSERCELRGDTTREGVVAYLRRVLDRVVPYFVVPSTQSIVHRVTVGSSSDRIQGFYLYTSQVYAEAQAIGTSNGAPFETRDICFKLLDTVALLHSMGHQRLRVLPHVGGPVASWRLIVVLAEDITYVNQLAQWSFDTAVFTYSDSAGPQVGALEIRPDTTPGEIAHEILARATDAGVGMDWAYAGWYSALLAESHRLGELPVSYCEYGEFPYETSWAIDARDPVAFPPPPRAGARHGFPGELSETPVELSSAADLVPFTSPPSPMGALHGDITKRAGFLGLYALFRSEQGAFIGLYAWTRDTVYRREPGFGWVRAPSDIPELDRPSRVAVNYRFIKSFEILAARDKKPDWELADRMRIFDEQSQHLSIDRFW